MTTVQRPGDPVHDQSARSMEQRIDDLEREVAQLKQRRRRQSPVVHDERGLFISGSGWIYERTVTGSD